MIYADHAATTPLSPNVLEAMLPFLQGTYGNPSSIHSHGLAAKQAIEAARETIALCLHTQPDTLIFTSGGSEANSLALLGWAEAIMAETPTRQKSYHLITSAFEHSAVLACCRHLEKHANWEVTYLKPSADGLINVDAFARAIRPNTAIASIMHVNNEVGTIQNIKAMADLAAQHHVLFHSDAVQSIGKLPVALDNWAGQALSASAHKFYGPKGAGFLWLSGTAPRPTPRIFGGGQEGGLRSGTQNVAAIVGMACALQDACQQQAQEAQRLHALQTYFEQQIQQHMPQLQINSLSGQHPQALPGLVNISVPVHTATSEVWVLKLDLNGIMVSSGSACHGENIEPSHVLLAMGKTSQQAQHSLRFSFGKHTTKEQLDTIIQALAEISLQKLVCRN